MTISIGVIGAGIMGSDHAILLHRDVPYASVVGIADVDRSRAETLAAGIPGCRGTEDALSLIDSVDAVVIASSDDTHETYVDACLAAGKPVLCEKPLAPTAAACRDIVTRERDVIGDGAPLVSVGFMRRFDPGYVEMKRTLSTGDAGTPVMVHSVGRGVSAPAGTSELSVTGSAIHDLDIIPWILDSPITEVCWLAPKQSPKVIDRQDPQFILARTADGVLSTIEIFLNAVYGYDIRCEVVGSTASISLVEPIRTVIDSSLRRSSTYAANWRPRFEEAYRLQDRAWIEALRAGAPSPLATAGDGLTAALVADAVIASMHAGGGFVRVKTPADA